MSLCDTDELITCVENEFCSEISRGISTYNLKRPLFKLCPYVTTCGTDMVADRLNRSRYLDVNWRVLN